MAKRLGQKEIVGEINLLGGTAMVLAFQARQSTKDVDAIFAPTAEIRAAAKEVAADLGLPEDWLNDAAKGFVSDRAEFGVLRGVDFPHLRILAPTPEYLLAMKVMASRAGLEGGRGDLHDIEFLLRLLGLRATEDVMALVERYYDPSQILPRSMFAVEEILDRLQAERQGDEV
ncbi:MAG: hypothetical protein ABI823_04730 [Bryobacteraceae bacterium]